MPTQKRRSANTKTKKRELQHKPVGSLSGASLFFYTLDFLSGSAALIYELARSKMPALTFGSTPLAAAAVIVALMGGMGRGVRGYDPLLRRRRRPLFASARIQAASGNGVFGE